MACLSGKVALVTGGSRGIGRGIVEILASEDAAIAIGYRSKCGPAAELVQSIESEGGHARAIPGDVSNAADAQRLVEETLSAYGRLDILVNNAGAVSWDDFLTVSEETWRRLFDVNVIGTFLVSQAAARVMAERRSGAIVNVGSTAALRGLATQVAYCATKGAINSLTTALAAELAPLGIRVNAVLPGGVPTEIYGVRQDVVRQRGYDLPLGRPGEPTDIGRAVLYFASDASSWVTGSLLVVDGGSLLMRSQPSSQK